MAGEMHQGRLTYAVYPRTPLVVAGIVPMEFSIIDDPFNVLRDFINETAPLDKATGAELLDWAELAGVARWTAGDAT